jgi:ubiquinone/menaquinone biosynthesis C-methylase UbiE
VSKSSVVHEQVKSQFGPVADRYTTSPTHANPEALAGLVALAQPRPGDQVLDVATGAGHMALALAPYVAEVIAYDLTAAMLDEVNRNAARRGLRNITTLQGAAECLPFEAGRFDIVTVRIASHHFADIEQAVREMSRVVKRGGRGVVVDTTVPEDDVLDEEINAIEKLRDPSHVRNYRPSEWRSMLEAAGLTVTLSETTMGTTGDELDFESWTSRMRTPAPAVAELTRRFRTASAALRHALDIQVRDARITFRLPRVTLVALK